MSIYDQSTTKFVLLAVPRSVSELQRSGEIFTAATLGKLFRKTMRTISISHRHSGSRFGTGQVSNQGARHYQLVFKSRRSADGRGRRGNNISTGLFISAFNDGHDSLVWHLPPLCPDGPCLTDFLIAISTSCAVFTRKLLAGTRPINRTLISNPATVCQVKSAAFLCFSVGCTCGHVVITYDCCH